MRQSASPTLRDLLEDGENAQAAVREFGVEVGVDRSQTVVQRIGDRRRDEPALLANLERQGHPRC